MCVGHWVLIPGVPHAIRQRFVDWWVLSLHTACCRDTDLFRLSTLWTYQDCWLVMLMTRLFCWVSCQQINFRRVLIVHLRIPWISCLAGQFLWFLQIIRLGTSKDVPGKTFSSVQAEVLNQSNWAVFVADWLGAWQCDFSAHSCCKIQTLEDFGLQCSLVQGRCQ